MDSTTKESNIGLQPVEIERVSEDNIRINHQIFDSVCQMTTPNNGNQPAIQSKYHYLTILNNKIFKSYYRLTNRLQFILKFSDLS